MTRRTDPHRKGAIIPADYEHALSYNLATTMDNWPIPSFGINCELDRRQTDETGRVIRNGEHNADGRCCIIGLHKAGAKWATHGTTGQCTACGARFVYGEVWRHILTGEYIHVGHICGAKYGLVADRTEFDREAGEARRLAAAQYLREQNKAERAEFLADHSGLAEALETDHPILTDMAARFRRWRSLTDKQIALAMKIVDEVRNPPPEEKHCPAPEGKQTFNGVVVGSKVQKGYYGTQIKITVKVETPDGNWLAYGTAPAAILDATVNHGGLRGCKVEITATLTRSDRDVHFAFTKRPRGKLVVFGSDHNPETCTGCQIEQNGN